MPKLSKRQNKMYALIIVFYFCMAHIILPYFKTNDFLFFFSWRLFSSTSISPKDISWGDGKSYLIRDMSQTRSFKELPGYSQLYHNIQRKNLPWINRRLESLKAFCKCDDLTWVRFKGEHYKYILYNEELPIVERINLK